MKCALGILLALGVALGLSSQAAFAVAPAAQVDDPEPKATRELVQRAIGILRSRSSDADDLDQASSDLLELGTAGASALAQHAAKECKSLRKRNSKGESKLGKAFDKRARGIVAKRMDRKGLAELDELRGVIREVASRKGLTKAMVKAESDPAFERLRVLLTVRAADVWAADEDLFESWTLLLDDVETEARWIDRWTQAREVLLADPETERAGKRLKAPALPPKDANGIADVFAWRADLATPMGESDQRILLKNEEIAPEIDAKEANGIRALNLRRILIGLNAQLIDVKLCEAGRGHSKDMKEHDFFAHVSPLPGKKSFGDRASLSGTSANAENIAFGTPTGPGVIMQWWYSPGHHKNMLGGQSRTGLGRFVTHWTQMFG